MVQRRRERGATRVLTLAALAILTGIATVATEPAALGAVAPGPSASPDTVASSFTYPPIWNVQAFLPDITSFQRQGYSIAKPACDRSGPSKTCPQAGSMTTTSGDTTSATDSDPVASLSSVNCSGAPGGLTSCMALGVDPSAKPVLVTTSDSGLNWRFGHLPSAMTAASSMSCPATGVCYLAGAAGNDPAVFSTHDGGLQWSPVTIAGDSGFTGARLVSITCPTETFCVTAAESLVTNTKSGTFLAQTPLLLVMQNPQSGFSLPSYKNMGPFCCQGSNWRGGFAQTGLPAGVGSVSCATRTSCVAFGGTESNLGFIEGRSDDGGRHWTSVSSHFTLPPGAHGLIGVAAPLVRCSSALICQLGYAVDTGLGGPTPYTIFRSDDGGTDWSYEPTPGTMSNLSTFDCAGPDVCFAAGSGIASSADSGATWSTSVSQSSMNAEGVTSIADISCVAAGTCWAVGSGNTGAYILDTVSTAGPAALRICQGARLPEIGDPCRPQFAMSGLSVAPSCWTGTGSPSPGSGQPASASVAGAQGSQRLEGESATIAGPRAVTGAWATLSVAPMCRSSSGIPASSSIVLQDLDGSAFFQVGVKYEAASLDDPNGSDELFTELEDGGAGSHPRSFGFAGLSAAHGSRSNPVPFTDVTWLQPLATNQVQVGLTETQTSGGTQASGGTGFSVDLYAPQQPAPGTTAPTPPTTFPFSGPAEFVFSCGPGGLGPAGQCAPGEKGSPGPFDTVDLVNEVGSPGAAMPGSCSDPLTFSDVQVDRGGWAAFPQLPGVSTSGSGYGFDPALGAWDLSAKDVSGIVPTLSQAELFAQDWSQSAHVGGPASVGAWQVQGTSPSAQVTAVAMSDQPCDTWAGVPGG